MLEVRLIFIINTDHNFRSYIETQFMDVIDTSTAAPNPSPSHPDSSSSLRRSSRARKPPRSREVVPLIERMRLQVEEQVEEQIITASASTGLGPAPLGLYDDPDDLHTVQQELADEYLRTPPSPDAAESDDHYLLRFDPFPPKPLFQTIFERSAVVGAFEVFLSIAAEARHAMVRRHLYSSATMW